MSQNCAFGDQQVRDPAYALLDSGATPVLLPGHMLRKGARSFEVTVNPAVGKEKARCWRNEVYAEDRAHPLLPLGRLANLLDTKFVWENGEALMQCCDLYLVNLWEYGSLMTKHKPRGSVGSLLDIDIWQSSTTRIMQDGIVVKGLAPKLLES